MLLILNINFYTISILSFQLVPQLVKLTICEKIIYNFSFIVTALIRELWTSSRKNDSPP